MEKLTNNDGKTIAIISYITAIGTIIAFVMNQNKQNQFASFHIRQALGIFLLFFANNLIGNYGGIWFISRIINLGIFFLLIMGLLSAIKEEEKKIPIFGNMFQDWFKNIR
ncbi:MAG: hypothetical protein L3J08_05140 [Flavobacteriaceae bacterium]|nr:hypothetical protein [Flavobacteriaceae bacterium]